MDTPIVAARRKKLRKWIDQGIRSGRFANDSEFARSIQMGTGELSGLLSSKSFGEKKASNLEAVAQMPGGYLVSPFVIDGMSEDMIQRLNVSALSPSQSTKQIRETLGEVKRLVDYIKSVNIVVLPAEAEDAIWDAALEEVLDGATVSNEADMADLARQIVSKIKKLG